MADDIVTRLNEQAKAPALVWLADAAAEIEALRAAGDTLAEAHIDELCRSYQPGCVTIGEALAAWQEARRG